MKERLIIFLGIFLFLSTSLPACEGIQFWTTEVEQERVNTIRYIADEFQLRFPDQKVCVIPVEENEIITKFNQLKETPQAPHIIQCASEMIHSIHTQKRIDTQTNDALLQSIGQGHFFSRLLAAFRDQGHYVGIPLTGWVQGIWYRGDWFRQQGIPIPKDLDSILKAAKAFNKPKVQQYGIIIGSKNDLYTEQVFNHLAFSEGFSWQEKDETVKLALLTSLLEKYKELESYTPPGSQNWRARDYYIQGRAAMMFYSTFIMDDLALEYVANNSLTARHFKTLNGAKFDPTLVSKTDMISILHGKRPSTYGAIIGITAIAGDRAMTKNTLAFMQFLFQPDVYLTWLHMQPGGMLPTREDVARLDTFHRDPQGIFQRYGRTKIHAIISSMQQIENATFNYETLQLKLAAMSAEKITSRMVYDVLEGKKSAEEAARWALEQYHQLTKD